MRHFVSTTFELVDDPSFLDSLETLVLPTQQLSQWTHNQKNAMLLWAAWKSQVTLMASMLSNGADVSATDHEGKNTLKTTQKRTCVLDDK